MWSSSVCPLTPSSTIAATVCCALSCVTMRQKLVSIDLVVFGNECNNENNYRAGERYWFWALFVSRTQCQRVLGEKKKWAHYL